MPDNDAAAADSSGTEHDLGNVLRQSFNCGVIVVDSQAQVRGFNSRAAAILKVTDLDRAAPLLLPQPLQSLIAQSLSSAADISNQQVALGNEGPVVHCSTVILPQGKGARLVAILHELSDIGEFEQHVERLHRLASAGTSAASMAHEIKNALVAVRTFLDLLIEKDPGNEMAEMASREVRRINSLASQMLQLAGPSKVTFEHVRLHPALEHALGLTQVQLAEKHITLERRFDARRDTIHADTYQLEQAFVNLFLNAIDAMSEGGRLSVLTEVVGAEASGSGSPLIAVSIHDTGMGIPPENLARLFDTFFTTKAAGTGLGLTITRRIVREHGGEIEVRSELNQGTTFRVLLPLAA